MPRPAAYLDRDGTINVDTDHVRDPDTVTLIPGAAAAIRRLNGAGVPVVIVTNQGGIARGIFTEAQYESVRQKVLDLLAAEGAHIDAVQHCPHHPDFTGPCDCRKPGLLNYQRAATALDLDPARSLFVGDRLTDVLPAAAFGGLGILVPSDRTKPAYVTEARDRFAVADTLGEAVDRFLATLVPAASAPR